MAWECFACGWDGKGESFALQGELLCPRWQSRQSAAGGWRLEKLFVFLCRLPPDPRLFTGEPPRNVEKICPAREETRIPLLAPPAAAPCSLNRCLLLRAVAPSFSPSRGGSVVAPPPGRLLRAGEWLQHSVPLDLQQPFGPLTSAPIPALDLPDYRLLGGTSNRGDRSPPCVGRFKERGFQRGEGNRNPSPL